MKRIFVKNINDKVLDFENLNYLKNVLRLKNYSEVEVFDGQNEYLCNFNGNEISIIKLLRQNEEKEIFLAVSAIRQPRLEWLIEKATEIGVTKFFIIHFKHSDKHINIKRLEKIAIEACKQSKRISVPLFFQEEFVNFQKNIDKSWVYGNIHDEFKNDKSEKKGLIIGPEGGFSESEKKYLKENASCMNFGKNVLKTETAAIVGCSLLFINAK